MSDLQSILKANKAAFERIVPFDPVTDKLLPLDFTKTNSELTDEVLAEVRVFSGYINDKLNSSNARYGIGGYAEQRIVYRMNPIFSSSSTALERESAIETESRTLHLGIDIWGKPNTAVIAPSDGIVHSFAFNNRPGDYGATIILSHRLQGVSFFTLYGHLSLNSIKNIQEGDRLSRGDIFAEFGIPAENGHWPPHLHFQVIKDIEGWSGDYPGVCKYSEREAYLPNCPDPDLILQMNQYV
ncbi:MAG: peptidoglycan DD-metalloendopeptidase family protein, partial [Bacteroidota bacterium]